MLRGKYCSTAGKDIVSGQIIVCVAVVVFLAFFLLREWITQQQPPLQEPEDAVEEPPVPEDIPALEPVPQPGENG